MAGSIPMPRASGQATAISPVHGYRPGVAEASLGSLDDPEALAPTLHIQGAGRLGWMMRAHELPVIERFPWPGQAATPARCRYARMPFIRSASRSGSKRGAWSQS